MRRSHLPNTSNPCNEVIDSHCLAAFRPPPPCLQFFLLAAVFLVVAGFARAQSGGSWQSQDINTAVAGSTQVNGSTIALNGAGADIWGPADGFRFYHQPVTGDVTLVARVTALENTHGWAKAGLMLRDSLEPDARNVFVGLTPTWHGIVFQARTHEGDQTQLWAGPAAPTPYWVRLDRRGVEITLATSPDGTAWTPLSLAQTFPLNASAYVGLAVSSHDPANLAEARFEHVALITPASDAPLPPSALTANPWSNSQVELVWSDNSTNETGFAVERAPGPDGPFAIVATTGANTRRVLDGGLSAGTSHSYRVRALHASGTSVPTAVASAYVPYTNGPTLAPTVTATSAGAAGIDLQWPAGSGRYMWYIERSVDGVAFSLLGQSSPSETAIRDTDVDAGQTYHYRVRSGDGGGYSPYSNVATATVADEESPPLGLEWSGQDVGAVGAAGNATLDGGTVTVTGAGADIYGRADGFHFYSRSLTGNGEIVARVTAIDRTHDWAKAGVMMRASHDPSAPMAFVGVNASFAMFVAARHAEGEGTGSTHNHYGSSPTWLKIVRVDQTFAMFHSLDGANWQFAMSTTIDMPATILVGLATTSHATGTLCRAVFDQISIIDSTTQPPPPSGPLQPPANLDATALSASAVQLQWADRSDNETGFVLERSSDGGTFSRLATVEANATTYLDQTVSPNLVYWYRVRSYHATETSAVSNTDTVAVPDRQTDWLQLSIGNYGLAGTALNEGSRTIVSGAGTDIWGTADGFHYSHRWMGGDFEILARVESLENTHSWAKAGLMIRETLDPASPHAFVALTPSNGLGFFRRTATGGATTMSAGPWGAAAPLWLRLVRSGHTFNAYWSPDGFAWQLFASETIVLGPQLYVGLAVTSHTTSALSRAVFDRVQLISNNPL